ncbi:MAG: MG2 domain-containing protein [Bacteroidales bacterium]
MKKTSKIVVVILSLFFVITVPHSCKKKQIIIDPGFSQYITAFTSGRISCYAPVKIILVQDVPSIQAQTSADDIFKISPWVKGKAVWLDARTIEFLPEEPFKQATEYICNFKLGSIIEVEKKYKTFTFSFETLEQAISVEIQNGYQIYSLTNLSLNYAQGTLRTADRANDNDLEQCLEATQNGKKLPLQWKHNSTTNTHHFTIDSISRGEKKSEVVVKWNGKKIGAKTQGSSTILIPSIFDFFAIEATVNQGESQSITIKFSDPIDTRQDLTGMITIDGIRNFRTEIDRMALTIYLEGTYTGVKNLKLEKHIKNTAGSTLKESKIFDLVFESIKPGIDFIGNGVILPGDKGFVLPFRAVNLRAVDVRIIQLFENNIPYFLQVNNLEGERDLKRSGRLVFKKRVDLREGEPVNLSKWNNFSLDLTEFVNREPGAIYRIQISFKKEYSIYTCGKETSNKELSFDINDNVLTDSEIAEYDNPDSYGYYYDDYYYEDDYNYDNDWSERDNPCSQAYYNNTSVTTKTRNILASNIGLIAKRDADNTMNVFVSDLLTTKPLSGVKIEVYNYQNQLISSGSTNSNGIATISSKSKGFLIIAKNDKQRGYLRIDDNEVLSMSSFNVGGEQIEKGLKGFIYTERGVWRPGDSIFVTFILDDKLGTLPADYPVIMELWNPRGQLYRKIVKTENQNGFYNFVLKTNKDDITGNWTSYIKLGNVTFNH